MKKKYFLLLLVTVFIITAGCGLDEDYPEIYPVTDIDMSFNNFATVRINNSNSSTPFTNFIIYYRIYISDEYIDPTTDTVSKFSTINSTLASNYNTFFKYIDSTDPVTEDMNGLFTRQNYKELCFTDNNGMEVKSEDILTSSVFNRNLEFDFRYINKPPKMTIMNGTSIEGVYTLLRSDEIINPLPEDRLFINSNDLWDPDNLPDNKDDVVNKLAMSKTERYTYAAMFIVAKGNNAATISYAYSAPALIHVFYLPEDN